MAAGQQAASTSVSVRPRGWDFSTTTTGSRLYFFDIAAGDTSPGLSVILTWNRTIADTISGPSWGNPSSSLANLSLKIYAATGFTTGALIDSSVSTVDNVEHLYEPGLPPGRYAIEVTGSQSGVQYGLAWYSVPTVTIAATVPAASEQGLAPGTFTITRAGETTEALTVSYVVAGAATNGTDYQSVPASVTIPIGAASATISITPIADTLAEGDEAVSLTLASDPAYSVGAAAAATVTIHDLPIDAWRFGKFTAGELSNPALSGNLADFELDGISNLMEYALNLEPKTSAPGGLPSPTIQPSGALALSYTRVKSATDITYVVEVSNDLIAWHSGPAYTSVVETIDHGTPETVKAGSLLSPGPSQRQFMRLKVTRP